MTDDLIWHTDDAPPDIDAYCRPGPILADGSIVTVLQYTQGDDTYLSVCVMTPELTEVELTRRLHDDDDRDVLARQLANSAVAASYALEQRAYANALAARINQLDADARAKAIDAIDGADVRASLRQEVCDD